MTDQPRGADLIAEERKRQFYNWGDTHDDGHSAQELAHVAAQLAAYDTDLMYNMQLSDRHDIWGLVEKHKDDRVRQLVVAGALIAAEIDRLQRLDRP